MLNQLRHGIFSSRGGKVLGMWKICAEREKEELSTIGRRYVDNSFMGTCRFAKKNFAWKMDVLGGIPIFCNILFMG